MTTTYKVAAASMAVLLLAASVWMLIPRKTHEIVVKPTAAVQR